MERGQHPDPYQREGRRTAVHLLQPEKAETQVITSWIKGFDEGKECWRQSCQDLNIGDLAMCDKSFLETEKDLLAHHGIHDFEIVCITDVSESIPFDRVLANSGELEEEEE